MRTVITLAFAWLLSYVHYSVGGQDVQVDNEQPYAYCIQELRVDLMQFTGTAILNAKEIEAGLSSDNNTPYEQLRFSFSHALEDTKLTFDCNDIGMHTIELWVTDRAGNQSYCTTQLRVYDSHRSCGMSKKAGYLANK